MEDVSHYLPLSCKRMTGWREGGREGGGGEEEVQASSPTPYQRRACYPGAATGRRQGSGTKGGSTGRGEGERQGLSTPAQRATGKCMRGGRNGGGCFFSTGARGLYIGEEEGCEGGVSAREYVPGPHAPRDAKVAGQPIDLVMQYEGHGTTHGPCHAKVPGQPVNLAMGGQSNLLRGHGPPQLLREFHRGLDAGAGLPLEAPQRS